MDKNCNAKQVIKKATMAVEKSKKSANKKKKKSKKSVKGDQNSDCLEIEGIRALDGDQAENESDSSANRPVIPSETSRVTLPSNNSPSLSVKSSISNDTDTNKPTDNDLSKTGSKQKPLSAHKHSVENNKVETATLKHTQSASVLEVPEVVLKKATVSFSNLEELHHISNSVSNMSVKSKNASQKGKTKSSSKSSSNGASKREREKTLKTEPQKSAINKAAEMAARIRSEESLRWEFALEDEEQEMERIRVYKINRRKRYLAAAQEKGLGWVVNYGNNGSPIADDSLSDIQNRESVHASLTDFSPVRSIITSQRGTPMNIGGEITC
ncbi:hypothetical protein ACF0H5_017359 [Mactra antiquata]